MLPLDIQTLIQDYQEKKIALSHYGLFPPSFYESDKLASTLDQQAIEAGMGDVVDREGSGMSNLPAAPKFKRKAKAKEGPRKVK